MDKVAVVIDTNIFGDPEKYNFNDIRTNTFFNSVKDASNIDVFIPDIVSNEIKKHIRESLEKDKKNQTSKYFKDYLDKNFYDKAYLNAEKNYNSILKRYKIKIIKCDNYINISDINNWYFNRIMPFEEAKPKEFPDAMIISAISNYFKNSKYNKKCVISNDNGFTKGLQRETDFITYKDINSIRKDLLGYDDNEIIKINNYLQTKKEIFKDYTIYNFESYDSNDEIDIDKIESIHINDVDILESSDNSLTVEVKIDAEIKGYFLLFDPYDSMYDNEDRTYYYIIRRECQTLILNDESFILEIIKDNKGNIIAHNNIECVSIDLTNYLTQMDVVYEQ